jgi:hypothetical protein
MAEIEIPWIISGPHGRADEIPASKLLQHDTAATVVRILKVELRGAGVPSRLTRHLRRKNRSGPQRIRSLPRLLWILRLA